MRSAFCCLFLACAPLAALGEALDWAAFLDPKSLTPTAGFPDALKTLPEAERATATKRLQDALASESFEIRRRAALALNTLGDKSGAPTMIRDMSTTRGRDRDNAAVALRYLRDARAIPVLRECLRDKSPYIRGIALAALGELKATEALADIAAHLHDQEEEPNTCIQILPSATAAYALGQLGDRKAIPALMAALADPKVRPSATQALTELTGEHFGDDVAQWRKWWAATQGR